MNIKEANEITGGLGNPSKMPGRSYGLPAAECKVGSKLRNVPNSVCSGCYALKGRYMFANVQTAEYRRLEAIADPQWVNAMVTLIRKQCATVPFFRWHDSGDVQSLEHLENIARIARELPTISFWLPTRELQVVQAYKRKHGAFPDNLTVRVSAPMVGKLSKYSGPTSSVDCADSFQCPAPTQGNNCQDCRACWNNSIKNINYHKH